MPRSSPIGFSVVDENTALAPCLENGASKSKNVKQKLIWSIWNRPLGDEVPEVRLRRVTFKE
jgi:hypothetical protein